MANSYSASDLVKGALNRVGEITDGTSPYHAAAIKYLNDTYADILKGNSIFAPEVREVWAWARQTAAFTLPANYETGTATVTQGNINGTFSVAPTVSLAGYNFVCTNIPGNSRTYYSIATHTAATTAFTLDYDFVEESGVYGFNAMPLTVTLSRGILRLADPLRQYTRRVLELGEGPTDMGRIYYMDYSKFWEMYPLEFLVNDIPSRFTIAAYSDSATTLRFNKYVSNPLRVDYDFISTQALLTDASTSVPLVPYEDRSLLELTTAYYLFLDKKQLADAENCKNMAGTKILSMKLANQGQQKLGKIFGQIIPRLDDTAIPYWLIQQR